MVKKLCFILCLLCSASWIQANTYTVTKTFSFAQAIAAANGVAGPHLINFAISDTTLTSGGATQFQITRSNVTIDATGKNITFTGPAAAPVAYGITIMPGANNCVIKGLTIVNFSQDGIFINNASGTVVTDCNFNTNVTATASVQLNMNYGIYADNAHNTKIGGSTAAERNYFAGIASSAVYFKTCNNVVVTGNYFGVTSEDTLLFADPNFKALHLQACSGAIIGRGNTAAERNLFCNSSAFEIEIVGTGTTANIITNNNFGYDAKKYQHFYYEGIHFTSASKNLVQNNNFAGTYGSPINATGTYIGNKLRQNSFESHSGNPPTGIINANVVAPEFYSTTSTIIKGAANPGDSIEIYYANSYAISGLTYINRVLVPANGKWSLTGTFIVGKTMAITATNNTNNTTSWFTSSTGLGTVRACTNNPSILTNGVCKAANLSTLGFYPNGNLGTTYPVNAAVWSTSGTGTFTNNAKYSPSITKYIPSAADIAGNTMSLTLTTTDTTCVNNSMTSTITFLALPVLDNGLDKFTCNNSTALTGTPSYGYNNWYAYGANASNASIANGTTNSPSVSFSAAGTYNIVREIYQVHPGAMYCYNRDTVQIINKPIPVAPTGVTLTTTTQKPVTYTVPAVPGEILSVYYYPGSATPSAYATVTSSGSTLTYVTSGAYYGAGSFSYTMSNQCSNTAMGSINVSVQNAPPIAIPVAPVPTVRGKQDTIIIRITDYVTDLNGAGDINLASIAIVKLPMSFASCLLNTPSVGYITINYNTSQSARDYVDLDSMRFQIADSKPNVTQFKVTIDRGRNLSAPSATPDEIEVFNGISPDGDGINDFLRIVNLSDYMNTVTIYDRWGDKVWEGENYNNTSVRFEGFGNVASSAELPNGTYFFVIKNKSRSENDEKAGLTSGYLVLTRQQ